MKNAIKFSDIPFLIKQVLKEHRTITNPSLENIMDADQWARDRIMKIIRQAGKC
jgi:1-deoxy-D-xylulose 5-phosphate reductoisomerase